MRRWIIVWGLLVAAVISVQAQNWEINTVHRVNSWDGKFVRNYNKVISRTEPYLAVGVPVAMAVTAWIRHDRDRKSVV